MSKPKNIVKEPFDQDFCDYLEYHLTRTFKNSEDPEIRKLGCDGILAPLGESQLTKKNVNDKRKIETKAWIGIDGQDEYEMVIHFGKYSLRRYAKGSRLEDTIPSEETTNWLTIDNGKKSIELQLK